MMNQILGSTFSFQYKLYSGLDLPIGPLGPGVGAHNARGRYKLSLSEFFLTKKGPMLFMVKVPGAHHCHAAYSQKSGFKATQEFRCHLQNCQISPKNGS